jgi:hypothetical protein
MVRDIWNPEEGRLYTWEEITEMFDLVPEERPFWRQLTNSFPRDWDCKLRIGPLPLRKREWFGLFPEAQSSLPSIVTKVPAPRMNLMETQVLTLNRPFDSVFYSVGQQSCTLHRDDAFTDYMRPELERNSQPDDPPRNLHAISGYVKRVRFLPLSKGKNVSMRTILLYYGPVVDLTFDPQQFSWSDGSNLLDYSAKKGREFIRQSLPQRNLAHEKWQGILPANHRFEWKQVWNKTRARKESLLIWLMWHQGVAVNAWRHRLNNEFSGDCCFCHPPSEETILHRFWSCPSAQRVWDWATSLVNKLRTRRTHIGPWPAFEMKQVIFSEQFPERFKKFKAIWPLLKGTCLWALWIQRNEKILPRLTGQTSKLSTAFGKLCWSVASLPGRRSWIRVRRLRGRRNSCLRNLITLGSPGKFLGIGMATACCGDNGLLVKALSFILLV